MKRTFSAVVILTGCALLLPAQSVQTMRASVRGGGGDGGKCTIEVEVDGVAEVEVRGDTGRIRTLEGQPSTWRRFECDSVLPRNPVDFRFKGVDGRGDVRLVRDPSNAGGVAVIRINDDKGGREGYTFDLEWRGGSSAGSYSRNDPYYRDDRRDDRWDRRDDRLDPRNDPNYNDRFGRRNDPGYDDRYSRNGNVYGNMNANQVVGLCQNAVRDRARRDYGVRNPSFIGADLDDLRGNRDRVLGSFEGNRGERYDYSCTINTNNGNIRSVDVRRR